MKVVVDWDGTVTEVDGLHMILERFGDPEVYAQMEGALGDGLSLHEVIEAEIATIGIPLERAVDWVRGNVSLRAGFREFVELWRPVILSSGFRELIEPVLERERVKVEVIANELDPRSDGWRPIWRDAAECATCGEVCKRGVLAGEPFVYAGDGYSDRCVALAASRVFARDGLAEYLAAREVPFEPFADFHEIARAL